MPTYIKLVNTCIQVKDLLKLNKIFKMLVYNNNHAFWEFKILYLINIHDLTVWSGKNAQECINAHHSNKKYVLKDVELSQNHSIG